MVLQATFYLGVPVTQPRAIGVVRDFATLDDLVDAVLAAGTHDPAAPKGAAGYVVAAPVPGPRSNAAAAPTRVVALDYDDTGAAGPDWTALDRAGRYVAYTTDSHQAGVDERWRVWLELDRAYDAAEVAAATPPFAGAYLRAISQPVYLPTKVDDIEWRRGGAGVLVLSTWAQAIAPAAAPFVPPARRSTPSRASTNALVARWLGVAEGTNHLAGATGSCLAEWGWSDDDIAGYLGAWLAADPKLAKHTNDALRGATKRRTGDRIYGFPELAKLLGQPFEADAATGETLDELFAALDEADAPDDEAALRAAVGGDWVQGRQVTERVTPPNWLVPRLGLAPGRYAGLGGYASAGKTWFAQGLVLAVAQGTPFCGLDVRQGRALHIDHEQGSDMTRERYQLLGFDGGTEDLAYVSFPAWRLSGENGKQLLARLARGRALIVIDSLRASVGGDENSSELRQWLDGVSEISEKTQCTILVLHHAKKGSDGDDIYKARGTGAIMDAAGCYWHLNLQDRDETGTRPPSRLVQAKPGRHPPGGVLGETPFVVTVTDLTTGAVALDLPEDVGPKEAGGTRRSRPDLRERVLTELAMGYEGSVNGLIKNLKANRNDVFVVVSSLREEGILDGTASKKLRLSK